MSIWGSLIGGFVGFSFAGPIGALIGSMIEESKKKMRAINSAFDQIEKIKMSPVKNSAGQIIGSMKWIC